MGLLDQVLGQVLGRLGGQEPAPQSGGGFSQGGGSPQGGGYQQGGYPQGSGSAPGGAQQGSFGQGGGGLPGALGGMLSGKGGPIALAILALLASKHMKSGAAGYGSILHDMFSGQRGDGGLIQGSLPGGGGVLGQNEGSSSGGFMNDIGGMLGGGQAGAGQTGAGGAGPGGMGGLGGMLTGGVLGSGLGELLERFTQNGHGDVASSWVGTGPNQPMSPAALETSLGSDTINDLSRETGMDRGDLLSQLSQTLPEVVDRLTPNGRLPTHDESAGWV